MIKYYEEIITRALFKYETVEERETHVKEMISNGWRCENKYEVPDGDPFENNTDWNLAAEFIK
jgi:hypothetical protein